MYSYEDVHFLDSFFYDREPSPARFGDKKNKNRRRPKFGVGPKPTRAKGGQRFILFEDERTTMDLEKLWSWDKRKIPCSVREETLNPAFDDLREKLAELAGVNLKDLLDDMKRSQVARAKKAAATAKARAAAAVSRGSSSSAAAAAAASAAAAALATTSSSSDATDDPEDVDMGLQSEHEATKKYKEILHRSHIVDATENLVREYDRTNTLGSPTTVASQNSQKRFTSVVPMSPPARLAVEIKREMAKSIIIPNPDDIRAASVRLQRKLAKQRASRKAMQAVDGGEWNLDAETSAFDASPRDKRRRLPTLHASPAPATPHKADILEGMIYLARMADSVGKSNKESDQGSQAEAAAAAAAKAREMEAALTKAAATKDKEKKDKDKEDRNNEAAADTEKQQQQGGAGAGAARALEEEEDLLAASDRDSKLYCAR